MPFAVVNGEPVTQLPRDLYIPPQALEVFLEAFEGPLDLLLYLIRRQNLNILDIPLAEITKQYMQYIELMQELQLELAGEYMLMAATLAEIKSRMLLPRPPSTGDGTEEDPRAELVRRLQEYERFKRAAEGIDTFITGEGPHWTYALAEDLGINVFYAGHYATETFGVKALAAELSRKFKVPWTFLDHPTGL